MKDKKDDIRQIEQKQKGKNLVDSILFNLITRVFTKDEWHTLVIGFFDGLSFSMQGKWHRKAFGNPNKDIEGIEVEKAWYYRVPYVLGEITKVILVLVLIEHYGAGIVGLVLGA